MNKLATIKRTKKFIANHFGKEASGHDWWHMFRVWKNATEIAKKEKGVDMFIIQMTALLHDVEDWKLVASNKNKITVRGFLEKLNLEIKDINHICDIIDTLSFKGAKVVSKMKTKEGMIVQDADRLDALGAVGIARVFMFSGHTGRPMYDPKIKPQFHKSFAQYKKAKDKGTAINHFYEKLLLLKGRMNTPTAKKIAKERHDFMVLFLKKFFEEWGS